MRLWEGLREERSVAVERPMPEEPPVMRIVFGVEMRVLREAAVGWNRDILVVGREVGGVVGDVWCDLDSLLLQTIARIDC